MNILLMNNLNSVRIVQLKIVEFVVNRLKHFVKDVKMIILFLIIYVIKFVLLAISV